METIIQDRYGGILQKHFVFYCWTRAGPCIRVREETALPACSVVEMALWWRIGGGEGWGACTGWLAVACGMDCEYWFLLVLRDSFSSGALV